MAQNKEPETIDYAKLEAKSRFASFFPKDLKFLIKVVEQFEINGEDAEPVSGFSDSMMMKERVLLKLNAYLDLFSGQDPESLDPTFIQYHMPEEFKQKYYKEIEKLVPKRY